LVDLAVAVPSCTLVAARRAVPLAARIGALGTVRMVERVSEAVYELRAADQVDEVLAEAEAEAEAAGDEPSGTSDGPAETISVEELPIEGYDDLAARQVVDRLEALDRADLGRIETYEREHRNRSTVLGKISMLTA
jgi:nucleotide-binding universal stress UspA family protein